MVNPFRDTIVTDPWESNNIDVPEINIDAFELCCEALEVVRAEGRTTSVLLYGEAGSGKTHLLGRLRTHLRQESRFHVFVSVRLQSSPHRFWRHIRKCFVESLMRRVNHGRSQLELVFLRRLYMLLAQRSKKKKTTVKELCQFIESLSFEANLSRNLCKALECLVAKRHRLDVIAWLKGDSLPESALMNLDLAQENEESDYPEDRARGLIMELCRLAGPTMPLIFCFDQIEALRRYPGDSDGLFVFGQAMRSLHDETNNVLLISCIQSFFHEELRNAIMDPDYTALAIHKRTLNPLTQEESLKLVWARLEGSPDLTGKKSELFLAFKKDLERYVGPSGQTARNVLSRCADLYDSWEKGVPIEREQSKPRQSDEEFLNEEKARREEQAIKDTTPERTDEVVQSALPVIINVMDKRWKEQDRKRPRDVDIVLEGPGLKVGISFCNQKNMTSLAARLRRVRSQFMDSDMDRLLLVRHPQLPISAGAKKVKEYLQDLMEQNVRLLNPDIEALAALEALRGLLGDAKSGDLANSGKPVGDGVVRDWLRRQLSGPALDFVDQVLTSHAIIADDLEIFQDLLELLDQERVIKLDDVAKKTGADFQRLQAAARQHPGQIGYIEGPPPVIFQFIPEGAQVD